MKLVCKASEIDYKERCLDEFLQHADSLYGFASRLTRTADDAKDLVQDTFLRAMRYIDRYEEGTNKHAWLFTIMHNLFINQYRKQKRNPLIPIEGDNGFHFDSPVKPEVFQHSFSDELMIAFNLLKPDMKTVLFLCDIENLKYDEISKILNIPLATVKTRIHRARAFLRKSLLNSGFFPRNN